MSGSISKKLNSHFREVELIKKGNKLTGVKQTDKIKEWEIFTDELFILAENSRNFNPTLLYNDFMSRHENLEKKFIKLRKNISWHNKQSNKQTADANLFHYITHTYSHETDLKIIDWKKFEGSEITESFLREFLSLMNIREKYAYVVVRKLKEIIDAESQKTKPNNSKQPTAAQVALFIYYSDESKDERISNPKKKFWETKHQQFGPSAKKIEVNYNKYNKYTSGVQERTKSSNISNLKLVIKMLEAQGYNKAVKLAEDDLIRAISN